MRHALGVKSPLVATFGQIFTKAFLEKTTTPIGSRYGPEPDISNIVGVIIDRSSASIGDGKCRNPA